MSVPTENSWQSVTGVSAALGEDERAAKGVRRSTLARPNLNARLWNRLIEIRDAEDSVARFRVCSSRSLKGGILFANKPASRTANPWSTVGSHTIGTIQS